MTRPAALILLLVVLAGCAGPSPIASPGPALSVPELRYVLIDRFGAPWFCDPDEYPIGRDEEAQARERFSEIEADPAMLGAILDHLGLAAGGDLTDGQQVAVYREWKRLRSVALDPIGNGRYRFDFLARPAGAADEGTRSAGTIAADGTIEIDQQAAAGEPTCPICLDGATRIDTPLGPIRVDALGEGAPVWTFDAAGRRIEGVVLAVRSVAVPREHRLVRLVLDDGRELQASPGHPLPDGRPIGEVRPGDALDGAAVVSAELVPSGPRTWDLLASGPTGSYVAGGIPLRSTLAP